jgi:hypothetical protein
MFSRRLWVWASCTERRDEACSSLGRRAALIEAEAITDLVANDMARAIEGGEWRWSEFELNGEETWRWERELKVNPESSRTSRGPSARRRNSNSSSTTSCSSSYHLSIPRHPAQSPLSALNPRLNPLEHTTATMSDAEEGQDERVTMPFKFVTGKSLRSHKHSHSGLGC